MKHSTVKLLIISFLLSSLALLGLIYHRELDYHDTFRDGLFTFFLISNFISLFGFYIGIKNRKRGKSSWIGIVGNLILIIPLSYISYKFVRYLIYKPDLKIEKLDSFNHLDEKIKNGEQIQILSYSKGKDCTKEVTYYYSVIAINSRTKDTIRILTPCQILSANFEHGTFNLPDSKKDSLLEKLGYDFGKNKFALINQDQPFQKENYSVIIGSISFRDEKNEILKEELIRDNIDTNLLDAPMKEIEIENLPQQNL